MFLSNYDKKLLILMDGSVPLFQGTAGFQWLQSQNQGHLDSFSIHSCERCVVSLRWQLTKCLLEDIFSQRLFVVVTTFIIAPTPSSCRWKLDISTFLEMFLKYLCKICNSIMNGTEIIEKKHLIFLPTWAFSIYVST